MSDDQMMTCEGPARRLKAALSTIACAGLPAKLLGVALGVIAVVAVGAADPIW